MKNTKDMENKEKKLSADPTKNPNMCSGCLKPKVMCKCKKPGGGKKPGSGESDAGTPGAEDGQAMSLDPQARGQNQLDPQRQTDLKATTIQPKLSPAANNNISEIEILLRRAKNMGLDPEKLLRSEGINIELKANMEELQRLAQNGDKMAMQLSKIAEANLQNRSSLASRHLDAVKNPFQTKNTKDK